MLLENRPAWARMSGKVNSKSILIVEKVYLVVHGSCNSLTSGDRMYWVQTKHVAYNIRVYEFTITYQKQTDL